MPSCRLPATARVCVIGAGAAGISVARWLRPHFSVTVLEAGSQVGGTWVYHEEDHDQPAAPPPAAGHSSPALPASPQPTTLSTPSSLGSKDARLDDGAPATTASSDYHWTSSMYRDLHTNLPHQIMGFVGLPIRAGRTFCHRSAVAAYLAQAAQTFELLPLIRFNTAVLQVQPLADGRWQVHSVCRDTHCNGQPLQQHQTETYDAVVVCNGHYSTPLMPKLPGLSNFRGRVLHSHHYRQPEDMTGKRVVVLGGGQSGRDISQELCGTAAKVILSHRGSGPLLKTSSVEERPAVTSVADDGSLVLENGSNVQADVLLMATGYAYDFFFLDPECGVKVDQGKVVSPLYEHVIHIERPTLAFIGLPWTVLPFPHFDVQSRFVVAAWTGQMALPAKTDMYKQMEADRQWRVKELGFPPHHAHRMGALQWDYHRRLCDLAKIPPLEAWRQQMYEDCNVHRAEQPWTYKLNEYTLDEATGKWSCRTIGESEGQKSAESKSEI